MSTCGGTEMILKFKMKLLYLLSYHLKGNNNYVRNIGNHLTRNSVPF
jgi:hypothetical protein